MVVNEIKRGSYRHKDFGRIARMIKVRDEKGVIYLGFDHFEPVPPSPKQRAPDILYPVPGIAQTSTRFYAVYTPLQNHVAKEEEDRRESAYA